MLCVCVTLVYIHPRCSWMLSVAMSLHSVLFNPQYLLVCNACHKCTTRFSLVDKHDGVMAAPKHNVPPFYDTRFCISERGSSQKKQVPLIYHFVLFNPQYLLVRNACHKCTTSFSLVDKHDGVMAAPKRNVPPFYDARFCISERGNSRKKQCL
jgi:uncharacterized protein (DUF983 family)